MRLENRLRVLYALEARYVLGDGLGGGDDCMSMDDEYVGFQEGDRRYNEQKVPGW